MAEEQTDSGLTVVRENTDEHVEDTLDAEAEHASQNAGEEGEEIDNRVTTAFLVIVGPDGAGYGTSDIYADIVIERPATMQDMFRACSEIVKDVQAIETAGRTLAMMQQTAMLAQQQAEAAKMQRLIQQKGGFRGKQR